MERRQHWDDLYTHKRAIEVSWYAPRLERSLAMIEAAAGRDAHIIDVGAGASTLIDDLVAAGHRHLTALDISAAALAIARERLGALANDVEWITGDVTQAELPAGRYDVWHDRAVFHFLTAAADRQAYARVASRALGSDGQIIIATFAPDGPTRCSGLDVVRYDGAALAAEFPGFALREEARETHLTPGGTEQRFVHCRLRRA